METDGDGDHPGAVLARLASPTAETRARVGVVADAHLAVSATGTWKVYERSVDRLRAAVAGLNGRGLDGVLFAGDLTKDGTVAEFERVDEVLADLVHPYAAIPGNHDLPVVHDEHESPARAEFEARYAPDGLPFALQWGDVTVVGLDSNAATAEEPAPGFEGRVGEEQLDWLDGVLADADSPLVFVHHNLQGTRDWYERLRAHHHDPGGAPLFENPGPLADVVAAHDAGPILTGHIHVPTTAVWRGVRELSLPALSSFPHAYVTVEVGPDGTAVRMHTVADDVALIESLSASRDSDRTLLAAGQLARLPLVSE